MNILPKINMMYRHDLSVIIHHAGKTDDPVVMPPFFGKGHHNMPA